MEKPNIHKNSNKHPKCFIQKTQSSTQEIPDSHPVSGCRKEDHSEKNRESSSRWFKNIRELLILTDCLMGSCDLFYYLNKSYQMMHQLTLNCYAERSGSSSSRADDTP